MAAATDGKSFGGMQKLTPGTLPNLGLENAPQALMRLFTGENFGKQLLKIADAEIWS